MDVLSLNDCVLRDKIDKSVAVKIAREGIAIKTKDNKLYTIKSESIKNAELFYSIKKLALRIYASEIYEVYNIDQNYIDQLKNVFSDFFKLSLYVKELEINNVLNGELALTGQNTLEFRNKNLIFDVPIENIEGVVDIRNEIALTFGDAEIRLITNKDTINEIKSACSKTMDNEMLTLEELSLVYPRGKCNFVFYDKYIRIIGSSYEHRVEYKNIKSMYLLDKNYISEQDKYVVLSIDPSIRQGQTKYDFIVISFDDTEVVIDVDDERLEKEYSGLLFESFVKIISSLCNIKEITSKFETKDHLRGLRCTTKAYEGQLYPLDDCLIFLPRAIHLDLRDISLVEFSRINVSSMQAKTFDMTIFCNGTHVFSSIPKEEFGILEQYFSEKNIKARSEIIEEVISSDEEDNNSDDEDDSMVVGDDSEEY